MIFDYFTTPMTLDYFTLQGLENSVEVFSPYDNFDIKYPSPAPIQTLNPTTSVADIFVSGIIKDEFDNLLIGAAIQNLNDKTKGTTTDFNAKFEFSAKPTDMLEVSFLGYNSQQFKASAMPSVVVLKEDAQSLDTVWITPTAQPQQEPPKNDNTMLYVGIGAVALTGILALTYLKGNKQKGLGVAKVCNNRTKCTGLRKNGTLKKGFKYGSGGKVIKAMTPAKKVQKITI